jgi:tetratricopeptide (TPR) repeat protein
MPGGVQLSRRYTGSIEAYNSYLQARFQWNRFSPESLRLAVDYARQALKADPKYAPALALLATTRAMMGYYNVEPPAKAWPEAREAAQQAVAIDDSLAEAHSSLGFVLALHYWDWPASEKEFRRALELNPASAEAHGSYATAWLVPHGRLEEANAEFRKALELDPLLPWINFTAAFSLLAGKQYNQAIEQYGKTLELKSDFSDIWWDRGMALALAGRKKEAIEHFLRAERLKGGSTPELGLMPSALIGDQARVRELLPRIAEWSKRPGIRPMEIAYCYSVAGDKDRAFAWIEKAIQAHDAFVPWLKVDPRIDPLRGDPRLKAYLHRIGVE